MMQKVKDWAAYLWDWAKRIFGRSKIIFTNVVGVLLTGWIELYDPISMFDWDSIVDKHQVAIAIGVGIQVLNMLLRSFASNGPASFRAKEMPMVDDVVPDENAEEISPKAH